MGSDQNRIFSRTPAVFLDRDGTIIEDRGYLSSPKEVVLYSDTVGALKRLQQRFKLFVVTNQSGIAKGITRQEDVERVNAHVLDLLAGHGIRIERLYMCPHQRSDNCPCIKPKPHFPLEAARDFGIDLPASFSVGDHPPDAELARNLGGRGVYVMTGHGHEHVAELPPDQVVVAGIGEAAEWILAQD
jgi:D-glycero-D-manno-heptose 1,7-bisphosphate phosphatase